MQPQVKLIVEFQKLLLKNVAIKDIIHDQQIIQVLSNNFILQGLKARPFKSVNGSLLQCINRSINQLML